MEEIQIKTNCFNLSHSLECGQCFRRQKKGDNYYQILSDRVVKLYQIGDVLYVSSNKTENLEKIITHYFDLNNNYEKIENEISKIDENIKLAVKNTSGLRILNQNFFETVISYIISANNNIPRISKSINKISEFFGEEIEFEKEKYFLFPTMSQLKKATISDFQNCGVGYRAQYLVDTIQYLYNNNFICKNESTKSIKDQLLKLKGIGPKVADCILLFSLKKKEVFPIDTRVKKVMKELYLSDYNGNNVQKEIQKYVKMHFGNYAGLVQEHLFYNKRMGRL